MATTLKGARRSRGKKAARLRDNASAVESVPKRPIWEVIVEIGSQIPDEEWAKVPDDASINYKHYLYGAPKKKA